MDNFYFQKFLKTESCYKIHIGELLALLFSAEPTILLIFGIKIAHKIDHYRVEKNVGFRYLLVATLYLMSIGLVCLLQHNKTWITPFTLLAFYITIFFAVTERTFRQRFIRDYAQTYGLSIHRLNATLNFSTRGSLIVAPLAFLIFSEKISFFFVVCIFFAFLGHFVCFNRLSKRMEKTFTASSEGTPIYSSSKQVYFNSWASWNILHLMLMNLSFGAMLVPLSYTLLHTQSAGIDKYLTSPVPLYCGLFLSLIVLTFKPFAEKYSMHNAMVGIMIMGVLFFFSGFIKLLWFNAFILILFGMLFGAVTNKIGSEVQLNLQPEIFSKVHTRAQVAGRVGTIIAVFLAGLLLDYGVSPNHLQILMGLSALVFGWVLMKKIPVSQVE